MSQHYPSNVISVSKFCKRCKLNTQHRVDDHRVTRVCLECQERDEAEYKQRVAQPEVKPAQEVLFA